MSRAASTTLATVAVLLLAGCQHQAYEINALYPNQPTEAGAAATANVGGTGAVSVAVGSRYRPEVYPGKLDGYWFERIIFGSGGKSAPDAIELMYCPIVPDATVCRVSVIWQKGVTNLLEAGSASSRL
jgi:hypothetical protein